MNVYDFDGTIYDGDSSVDFYLFCLKKQPDIVRYFVKQIYGMVLYKFKIISKTRMKEYFFCFLKGTSNVEDVIEQFWNNYRRKIKNWYIVRHQDKDVVISASPEFLLEKICRELGIKTLIASRVDIRTGKFLGKNCRGEEKVVRFFEKYPDEKIDDFYSDSISDLPFAQLAENPFWVHGDQIFVWEQCKRNGGDSNYG